MNIYVCVSALSKLQVRAQQRDKGAKGHGVVTGTIGWTCLLVQTDPGSARLPLSCCFHSDADAPACKIHWIFQHRTPFHPEWQPPSYCKLQLRALMWGLSPLSLVIAASFPPKTGLLDSCHYPTAESCFLVLFVTVVRGNMDSKAPSICPCCMFTRHRGPKNSNFEKLGWKYWRKEENSWKEQEKVREKVDKKADKMATKPEPCGTDHRSKMKGTSLLIQHKV